VEDREACACRSCRRRAEHRTQDFFACAEPCRSLSLSFKRSLSSYEYIKNIFETGVETNYYIHQAKSFSLDELAWLIAKVYWPCSN
jgi:hypothetical protein